MEDNQEQSAREKENNELIQQNWIKKQEDDNNSILSFVSDSIDSLSRE